MNKSFSLGSLMMIFLVASMTMTVLGYLINIAFGGLEDAIWFFPMTSLAPMLLMILVSWWIKIYRVLTRTETRE